VRRRFLQAGLLAFLMRLIVLLVQTDTEREQKTLGALKNMGSDSVARRN
jgi:hypothetical protein